MKVWYKDIRNGYILKLKLLLFLVITKLSRYYGKNCLIRNKRPRNEVSCKDLEIRKKILFLREKILLQRENISK